MTWANKVQLHNLLRRTEGKRCPTKRYTVLVPQQLIALLTRTNTKTISSSCFFVCGYAGPQ